MKNSDLIHEIECIQKAIDPYFSELTKESTIRYIRFLNDGNVLILPRSKGDSRYVYGDRGFNFWVHASGYIYASEGLFSLFSRRKEGEEPVIAFFAGLPKNKSKKSFYPVSLLPVPVIDHGKTIVQRRYAVMNKEATYFFTEFSDLQSVVRVTINEINQLFFSVHLSNRSGKSHDLYLSSYFRPFCRHQIYESDEDRWFGEMQSLPEVKPNGDCSPALLTIAEDVDRFTSETFYAVLSEKITTGNSSTLHQRQTTTSRIDYMGGIKRNLGTSLALAKGNFTLRAPITTFADLAIAGDINTISIAPRGEIRIDYRFALASDQASQQQLAGHSLNLVEIDSLIPCQQKKNREILAGLEARISGFNAASVVQEQDFNEFFDHLKYQVSICGLLKGYMQLAPRSLIGIRDVFQALEGLHYYRPGESREKMLEALGFTTPSGRCLRQYSLPPKGAKAGSADLRPFIDQGVWIINAVSSYLRHSGDREFLNLTIGYHEIIDESGWGAIGPLDQKDSVLEHLFKIMNYLDRNRDHDETKLLCALYGDWNDALDGLGIAMDPKKKFGTGVSVMATLQYYQNCGEMIDILTHFFPGKFLDRLRQYGEIRAELAENLIRFAIQSDPLGNRRIVHGWGDRRSYHVASYQDPDGKARDGSTSNAFWVIADMLEHDSSLETDILAAFKRLDSKYGIMTFNPAFQRDTKGVGRIPKLPPGTAENGATYIHATLFAIRALYLLGQAREAWQQIEKILPFTPLHKNYTHSPFVMPNSYVYNPEKGLDGESMNDWQTGSSNVLLKVLVWHVFGYSPEFSGVRIQPANWLPFSAFEFTIDIPRDGGKKLRLEYRKQQKNNSDRDFVLNQLTPLTGEWNEQMKAWHCFIPWEELGEITDILIIDPL